MKAIPYLLGGALIAPGALLAYFIWSVNGAIRQQSLLKFIIYLCKQFLFTLEWAYWFIFPAILVWLALAFIAKYRWLGALGMSVVAIASLIEFFAIGGPPKSINELFFPVMSASGLALNIWLAWDGINGFSAGK